MEDGEDFLLSHRRGVVEQGCRRQGGWHCDLQDSHHAAQYLA